MSQHQWRNEYQLLLKGHTDTEPRRLILMTDEDVQPGHTFHLGDGKVALVGDVDGTIVRATYWFFDPIRDVRAHVEQVNS